VENLVGWVKGSFFKCRRFHDAADRDAQLRHWLVTGNTERPSRATGEIPAVRLAQERARLRPLAIAPADYALAIPVVVNAQGRVIQDGREYSMSPDLIGQPATLRLYVDRAEITTKTGSGVRHPRLAAGQISILPEHRRAMVDAVRGARGRLYYQRQSLWELGPAAEQWLTELVHRRPAAWRRDVEQCFTWLQDYGPTALREAFAWGVRHHVVGAEYVATALARQPAALQEAGR
jgi:hypothetical protein